ncbi:MAG: CBS domain-containing protein [Mariprofundaceae bacterium]
MNPKPPYCVLDTAIEAISRRFSEENLSGLLVLDADDRLMGVITENDLIEQQQNLHIPTALAVFDMVIPIGEKRFEEELERLKAMTAGDLVGGEVKTVAPDASLQEVASIMTSEGMHHLPVVDGDAVVGVITSHDVVVALAGPGLKSH